MSEEMKALNELQARIMDIGNEAATLEKQSMQLWVKTQKLVEEVERVEAMKPQ